MQIRYLMSGPVHFPYLIVSIMTLRKFHNDPITIYAYRTSMQLAKLIASDERLNVKAQLWEPQTSGDKSQLIEKLRMVQAASDPVLYLDADTMILGRLDGLIQTDVELVATQCNNDSSMTRKMKSRIRRLRKTPEIPPEYVQKALYENYPTLNGGVFVSRQGAALDTWAEWTEAAFRTNQSVPDETVLNVLQTKENVEVVTGYNVRPGCDLPAKIIHGYAYRWWRTNDPKWFDCLKEVESNNFGNFQKWKHLSDLFTEYQGKQREASMIMRKIRQGRRLLNA